MTRFHRQRMVGWLLLVLASLGALGLHERFRDALPKHAYLTGWALFGVLLLLALYNARKKLTFLPLGRSESWLQFHLYGGFFSVVLFLIHLNFRPPTGWFEGILAWLFLLVTVSGVAGWIFSRLLPRRLSTRGGEVVYERIPALRYGLRQEAETLAFPSGSTAGSTANSLALAQFYQRELAGFFAGPRHFWAHLLESRRPLNVLLSEMDDLRRYLNESERATLEKLRLLVRQKDGLDYHRALQSTLKLWLFVHVPLTFSLMIFALLHIVIVFAFSGGTR